MKKLHLALLAALLSVTACGQSNEKKESDMKKTIVVFYSQTNNTRQAAQMLAEAIGADIAEIDVVKPYNDDMWKAWDEAQEERKDWSIRPLKNLPDISAYETVVIGTPVWGYTLANPVFAFMRQADLSGKRVYGFWTFYDHDEKCDADFKAETRGGEYVKGLPLPRSLTGNRSEYKKAIRAFAGLVTGTDSRL